MLNGFVSGLLVLENSCNSIISPMMKTFDRSVVMLRLDSLDEFNLNSGENQTVSNTVLMYYPLSIKVLLGFYHFTV